MSKLNIGTHLDLDKLIESRMLVQASSGAGKTYMLRVLAEQALPHMPVIALDWDGELVTLREKFDVVIAGPSGDVPCEVKSASLLSLSLIERQVAAVVDLSDLEIHQRREFVKNFLSPLTDRALKKSKWPSQQGRAVMITVDEAHMHCPQKDKSVASQAVISLQSLGRKRGLVGVLATQRLSKLDKDAAAECSNIVVGRCSMVDSARACDELGLPSSYKHDLTQLKQAEWKAVGPAFKEGLQEFRGAKAKTTHAKTGAKMLKPPAPSAKIRKIVPELEAIQTKTTQEIDDLKEAKKAIANLKRKLTQAEKQQAVKTVEKPVPDDKAVARAIRERDQHWRKVNQPLRKAVKTLRDRLDKVHKLANTDDILSLHGLDEDATPPAPSDADLGTSRDTRRSLRPVSEEPAVSVPVPVADNGDLTKPQLRVLNSLAWWQVMGVPAPAKELVAVMAGYKLSGTFRNYLGQLNTGGYIAYSGDGTVHLTEAGAEAATFPDAPGSLDDVHRAWREKLTGPQQKIFDILVEAYPEPLDQEELADQAGYSLSGTFRNYLGQLRSLGIISKRGDVVATDLVFPAGGGVGW